MISEKCVLTSLTSTEQYLQLLSIIQKNATYIQLVQVWNESDQDLVISKAIESMELIEKKYVNKWLGTVRKGQKVPQYLFLANEQFFQFLKGLPSFFFNYESSLGYNEVEETEFGHNDIAFLDKERQVLFYTTTHEGYAYVNPILMK